MFLTLSAAVAIVWRRSPRTAGLLQLWQGHLLMLPGVLLLALRDRIPDFLSVVIANVLVALSVCLLVDGLRTLCGRALAGWVKPIASTGVGFTFTYFLYAEPSINARVVVISAISAALFFAGAWPAARIANRGNEGIASALIAGSLALMGLILAGRAVLTGAGSRIQHLLAGDALTAATVIGAMICGIGWTVGAITLTNARLQMTASLAEAQLRRQNSYLEALHATALGLLDRLDSSALLEALVGRAAQLVGAPHAALYLESPDALSLECAMWVGCQPSDRKAGPGEGAVGRCWARGEPVVVNDYDTWQGRSTHVPRGIAGAVIAVPLRAGSRVTGALTVAHDPGKHVFTAAEAQVITSFGQLASLTLDNARLLEAERSAREQAERLHAATKAVSASLDLGRVLDTVLSELGKVVPFDSASIQAMRGDGLEIVGGRGYAAEQIGRVLMDSVGDGRAREVLKRREPLILNDSPHFAGRGDRGSRDERRSWLGVPLLFGDRAIGILALNKDQRNYYRVDHAMWAWTFAAQAAAALEHARMFTEMQHELTERRRTQDALERSEANHRDLFEQTLGLICTHDLNGVLLSVNPAAAEVLGYAPEDMRGRNLAEFMDPSLVNQLRQYLSTFDARAESAGVLQIRRRDGQDRLWRYRNVLRQRSPEAPYVIGFAQDVTEELIAQRALEESEASIRSIIQTAHNAFIATDEAGRITEWNARAEALFGWSRDEARGRVIDSTLVPPGQRAVFRAAFDRLRRSERFRQPIELSVVDRRGRQIPVEMTLSLVKSGTRSSFVAFLQDITARKQLESMREDLTHTIVHDLRNPVTAIMGFLDLLNPIITQGFSSEHRRMVDATQSSASKLLTLVDTILDVGRLEQRAMPVDRKPLSLAAVLAESLETERPLAMKREIRLESCVPEALPFVNGDAILISRVMQNLLGNAIKFTPTNGMVRVSVEPGQANGDLLVSVEDTGPGIPSELKPRLFQRFSVGADKLGRGTGLGLLFCRLAVEAHGGRIWVDDGSLGGAAMRFTLPTAPTD